MLVHDLGFTKASSILIVFGGLNVFDLLRLVQLVYSKTEESSELVQEFFEDEFGVYLALAMSGKLPKHLPVLNFQQEIISIIYPFEIHVE